MEYQKCVKIPKKGFHLPYPVIQPSVKETDRDDNRKGYDDHKVILPDSQELVCHPEKKDKDHDCPRPVPNPVFHANATLPLLTPVDVDQVGNTIFVTASIPAEAIITLPDEALEIKRISKKLKITQCRFFPALTPPIDGAGIDTPKLFLGGFVRKDIQFVKVKQKTLSTVEGEFKDFVVDIPVSGVIDLGRGLNIPDLRLGDEREFEFARRRRLGDGFPEKERLLSGDFTENNIVSTSLFNRLPRCELVFSQIQEMDEQLDRKPLYGGPFEEGTFRTIQEKMVIVVRIAITFREFGC